MSSLLLTRSSARTRTDVCRSQAAFLGYAARFDMIWELETIDGINGEGSIRQEKGPPALSCPQSFSLIILIE